MHVYYSHKNQFSIYYCSKKSASFKWCRLYRGERSFLLISGYHRHHKADRCCPCKKLMPFHKYLCPFLIFVPFLYLYFIARMDISDLIAHCNLKDPISSFSCTMTGIEHGRAFPQFPSVFSIKLIILIKTSSFHLIFLRSRNIPKHSLIILLGRYQGTVYAAIPQTSFSVYLFAR